MSEVTLRLYDRPIRVTFERRGYGGGVCYCWAYVHNDQEVLDCGDPWPGADWPKARLIEAVKFALMGKVLV